MKNTIASVLVLITVFLLSACGKNGTAAEMPRPEPTPAQTESAALTNEKAVPVGTPAPAMPPKATEESPETAGRDTVDVDLTQLSSTMVYSEVYAMMYEPEQYMGKTIKMNGLFSAFEGRSGEIYYACIVQDATACCAQGLEFELKGPYSFPDDYPAQGEEITVVGTFDTYQEEYNGNYYLYIILRNAELV